MILEAVYGASVILILLGTLIAFRRMRRFL